MIFGDSKRELDCGNDKRKVKKIYGMIPQTDKHVGPGSYFLNEDPSKNYWIKNKFTKKQPMSSGSKTDRSSTYTNGVLTSLGVAHPGSPHTRRTPGPGYYSPAVTQFSPRPKSAPSPNNSRMRSLDDTALDTSGFGMTSVMGSSPRIVKTNSIIRNGVVFEGTSAHAKNSPFGPGHYFVETDNLNKKSFNVRASSSKNHASATATSPANNGNSTPIRSRSNSVSLSRSNSNNSLNRSSPSGSGKFSPQQLQYQQHLENTQSPQNTQNNNMNVNYVGMNMEMNDQEIPIYSPNSSRVKPNKVHTPLSVAAYEKLLKTQQHIPVESVLKNRQQAAPLQVKDLTSH